ncbi:hypothetical protein [Dietzia sp. MNB45]|uniref:hypothetical protein n=1 Tax=Dietzia sp. MNB45 TaxID=3238800 RepID=UPI003F7EF0C1
MAMERALEQVNRSLELDRLTEDAHALDSLQALHGSVTRLVGADVISTARGMSAMAEDETELKLLWGIFEPYYQRSHDRVQRFGQ